MESLPLHKRESRGRTLTSTPRAVSTSCRTLTLSAPPASGVHRRLVFMFPYSSAPLTSPSDVVV